MRSLAHIERVHNIRPIDGADKIEQVSVLGWNVIVKKGEFKEGDLCIYVEIDSKLPENDKRFAFLETRKYKIKTIKMKGVISQGIVFHLSEFPELKDVKVGDDVTEKLGITKIETEEERRLLSEETPKKGNIVSKFIKTKFGKFLMKNPTLRKWLVSLATSKKNISSFPSWIKKTDEIRIQNAPHYCSYEFDWTATEKVDGTSTTFGVRALNSKKTKYEFVVCSRNVRQAEIKGDDYKDNVYWEMAIKHDIKNVLTNLAKVHKLETLVLQGETIGPKIQGNPYKVLENKFYAFNLVVDGYRVSQEDAQAIYLGKSVEWVPVVYEKISIVDFLESTDVNVVLGLAEGKSKINPSVNREGLVFRDVTNAETSFKAVANSYLLKKKGD